MAVLNDHKKIAYSVQKWLMTRPAIIVLTVNDRTSMDERKYNISTSEERKNGRLNGEGKVINFGVGKMQIQEVAKGRD